MGFLKYTEKVEVEDTVIVYLNSNLIYAIRIERDKVFQTKYGALKHNDVVGTKYGSKVNCSRGYVHILFPTPELWTLTLPHRTQILYTPDISLIITQLDIKPGSVVCEAGTGSGSLSHALARTIAPEGHLYSFDFHEQRVKLALEELIAHGIAASGEVEDIKNRESWVGLVSVQHRDVCKDGFGIYHEADAVFLDLPAPWMVVPHAVDTIRITGGRLCSFSPCIEQVQKTCTALLEHGFNDVNTMECLVSGYEVKNYYFPPINWNKSKKKESSEDASSTSQVDDGETNATDGSTAVTVPPLKKTGHTGYLTFATLPPS